ncbi:MAG: ADP-L-glycero-D-manno-heptose 6-epimerase [Flavobacteriales bacterium]|jgi:ADP-L-glycero-D-manno-heptose 6-epimerase
MNTFDPLQFSRFSHFLYNMIVITGAAGFISSCLVARLNEEKHFDLVLVDDFTRAEKVNNYANKKFTALVDRDSFELWLEQNAKQVDFIFHLGARTDTTEFDEAIFDKLNMEYSKMVWKACVKHAIPLVYASSAATYGLGEFGYEDNHDIISDLKPLNPYGRSKNDFDIWALAQKEKPHFWAGLKFFNVYGPNEFHKGRMASVVFHAFNQISSTEKMNLFRSHNPDYKNGEQIRDFIYVKDLVDICMWLMMNRKQSGLYNTGTGQARTFLDLVRATFKAMDKPEDIGFIDTPADIRDKYQYFTEANMSKLREAGYTQPFTSLEDGVKDYVQNYLTGQHYY